MDLPGEYHDAPLIGAGRPCCVVIDGIRALLIRRDSRTLFVGNFGPSLRHAGTGREPFEEGVVRGTAGGKGLARARARS